MSYAAFKTFTDDFKALITLRPDLIAVTLSNIFTMRLIGNKTHGDLAEIAIAEFINQYMDNYTSVHVGKDLYRAKSKEEDIKIICTRDNSECSVSLKAYGNGPLQLSTDKNFRMFPRLQLEGAVITDNATIEEIFNDPAFSDFSEINVFPLIYDEKQQLCNIMVYDYVRARANTSKIVLEKEGNGRQHPVYRFYASDGAYICEVRYGSATANALQRGLWTHTKNGLNYFDSITDGWVSYSHNQVLVQLFAQALISTGTGHAAALEKITQDIVRMRAPITTDIL